MRNIGEQSGFKLVGGHEGASGERFTIYHARTNAPQTAMRYKAADRVAGFYWVDHGVAHVVTGPTDRDRLQQVAQAAYDQIDRASPARTP